MTVHNRRAGIFFMLCAALSFSLMNVFARLAGDVPALQKTFFRNAVAIVVITVLLIQKKQPIRFKKGTIPHHFLRSLFGTIGVVGNFYAVDRMLLSDATILIELSPFFVIVFSALFLHERVALRQWPPIFLALLGAVFVIRPTAGVFGSSAAFVALATAVFAGAAYTMVRRLNTEGEYPTLIIFFFSAFSCLFCLPSLLLNYTPLTVRQALFLLGAAVFGCCGQFSITTAYRYAPGSEISIFDYSQIVFSSLFGWLIFGQLADCWSYLGYAIIIAAAMLVFLSGAKGDGEKRYDGQE